MLYQMLFSIYFIFLILIVIFSGINFYKLRDKKKINPQIVVYLIPFIGNYCLANTIFTEIDPLFTTLLPCLFIFFIGRRLGNVRIFGLTGGIASGKSSLTKQMRDNLPKLHVIDCDQITAKLRIKGNKGYKLILKMLGQNSAQYVEPVTGEIERQKFSDYVFGNPSFRKQLSKQMGKLIIIEIFKDIFYSIVSNHNLIMIDAPTLYETKVLQYICFPIIVVGCSEQKQILRLQQRNKYTKQQAIKRIRSQMPLSAKQKKCDIYIKNQGSLGDLLNNTLSKLNKYLQKK